MESRGVIRVGRLSMENGMLLVPHMQDFTPVFLHSTSSNNEFAALHPCMLRDKKNRIFENLWQFSHVYSIVQSKEDVFVPAFDLKSNRILPSFYEWRVRGMTSPHAISFPLGRLPNVKYHLIGRVPGLLTEEGVYRSDELLNLVEATRKLYVPIYSSLASQRPEFRKLQRRLDSGENLLLLSFDGPRQETMPYYVEKCNQPEDLIQNHSFVATPDTLEFFLSSHVHFFGHAAALAKALVDDDAARRH